jgi:hypothetical protein
VNIWAVGSEASATGKARPMSLISLWVHLLPCCLVLQSLATIAEGLRFAAKLEDMVKPGKAYLMNSPLHGFISLLNFKLICWITFIQTRITYYKILVELSVVTTSLICWLDCE